MQFTPMSGREAKILETNLGELSIYQFRHTAQSGGRGKHNRMSLMMRRSPRVNHEVLLRATFLG
jgi:hypothetical protein